MTPVYFVMTKREAERRQRPVAPARKDWRPIVEALGAGKTLFIPDSEIDDGDIKYLQLAFARRGQNERLSVVRVQYQDYVGRQLAVSMVRV